MAPQAAVQNSTAAAINVALSKIGHINFLSPNSCTLNLCAI